MTEEKVGNVIYIFYVMVTLLVFLFSPVQACPRFHPLEVSKDLICMCRARGSRYSPWWKGGDDLFLGS